MENYKFRIFKKLAKKRAKEFNPAHYVLFMVGRTRWELKDGNLKLWRVL